MSSTLPDLELTIRDIWAQVIFVSRPIGLHDHFFEIGGDSLAAAIVVSQLAKQTGLELSILIVFECPTIAELAAHIRQLGVLKDDGK